MWVFAAGAGQSVDSDCVSPVVFHSLSNAGKHSDESATLVNRVSKSQQWRVCLLFAHSVWRVYPLSHTHLGTAVWHFKLTLLHIWSTFCISPAALLHRRQRPVGSDDSIPKIFYKPFCYHYCKNMFSDFSEWEGGRERDKKEDRERGAGIIVHVWHCFWATQLLVVQSASLKWPVGKIVRHQALIQLKQSHESIPWCQSFFFSHCVYANCQRVWKHHGDAMLDRKYEGQIAVGVAPPTITDKNKGRN